MNNTAIIILAAGNSSRFGSIKQLLRFNNKTLLQHVIDEASETGAEPIVVVTGANAEEVSKAIKNENVEIVLNENWKQGMASGIVAGLKKAITLNNDIENVIITVCDQPFISSTLFQQLYQTQNGSVKHIVASAYANTIGTPALFTQSYFDALLSLLGEEGAKKILLANKDDVATIDFPQGNIDIDTQDDYKRLLDKQRHVL
jgi:molybdenum cofactor cytidylyltransferase